MLGLLQALKDYKHRLGVQVEWPLNMVVDRSTQNLYQALLRHLLGLAMVERELHIIWRTYQSTRALFRRAPLAPLPPRAAGCLRPPAVAGPLSA